MTNILTLLLGGSGGAIFTWYWQRRKAKAEATQAEVSAAKEMQDMYQQMIADKNDEVVDKNRIIGELRDDRDHYKRKSDELSDKLDKLTHSVSEWKNDADERIRSLQSQVARNGRQIACLRPMLCGRENCAIRIPMTITEAGDMKQTTEIEPVESDAL
jgi:peptidoglycan hydrolase CwlO-like protein